MLTCPSSSTCATVSSADPYFAQRVTSAVEPSVKRAVTRSGIVAPASSVRSVGVTSMRFSRGSLSRGPGRPEAIQPEMMSYSGDPTLNRVPPMCGHGLGRLQQDQALGRLDLVDAATTGLPRDRVVVGRRVVAAERQPEAVLPGGRAVARARIAAGLRQDRDDLIAKRDRGTAEGASRRATPPDARGATGEAAALPRASGAAPQQ